MLGLLLTPAGLLTAATLSFVANWLALIPWRRAKQQHSVDSKTNAIHPHLYDRLLAAGVTPGFPRPAPARSQAWNGVIFSWVFGFMVALLLLRLRETW